MVPCTCALMWCRHLRRSSRLQRKSIGGEAFARLRVDGRLIAETCRIKRLLISERQDKEMRDKDVVNLRMRCEGEMPIVMPGRS